jgi:hypothetical protein
MNPRVRAIIRWVPASRGGRRQPPRPVAGYAAPARFESDAAQEQGPWSLRIAEASELRGGEAVEVRVTFVMPDAPHDLLREGERFELLEGRKVVAKGVVVSETVSVPDRLNEFELALLG